MTSTRLIRPGDTVFIISNDGTICLQSLPNKKFKRNDLELKLKKGDYVNCAAMINQPYNTIYEIDILKKALRGPLSEHPDPEQTFKGITKLLRKINYY